MSLDDYTSLLTRYDRTFSPEIPPGICVGCPLSIQSLYTYSPYHAGSKPAALADSLAAYHFLHQSHVSHAGEIMAAAWLHIALSDMLGFLTCRLQESHSNTSFFMYILLLQSLTVAYINMPE